ncbi:MAG: hypothetical protein ABJR07_06995 [Lentilitoribacter sp.]
MNRRNIWDLLVLFTAGAVLLRCCPFSLVICVALVGVVYQENGLASSKPVPIKNQHTTTAAAPQQQNQPPAVAKAPAPAQQQQRSLLAFCSTA